ncbi:hypothetical protein [Dyella choica]|uniref:Uncharacterized protein n=1 Tax=Dyella choica TaxID=1927959 RepID=A0A432LZ15_9GAMM|nr:hypothetical protein [Dyella choica]RUL68348.1 hypothetical protein EKH80_23575 [Dyella choica]
MPTMDASLTISAALLAFQFFFNLILALGIWILARGYNPTHGIRIQRALNPASFFFLFLVIFFVTMGPILMTRSFASMWLPTYGANIHSGLSTDGVKAWVFIVDILIVSTIILKTGGWKVSPFPPLNFSVPAIAILLGDSGGMVAVYTCLLAVIYGGSLASSRRFGGSGIAGRVEDDVALWIVTTAALALTTTIGVFTRHAR